VRSIRYSVAFCFVINGVIQHGFVLGLLQFFDVTLTQLIDFHKATLGLSVERLMSSRIFVPVCLSFQR